MSTKNNTVYLANLPNAPISNIKQDLLKIFEVFGEVKEVKIIKSKKMKRQAFVVFIEDSVADMVIRKMKCFPYMGCPLTVRQGSGERRKQKKKKEVKPQQHNNDVWVINGKRVDRKDPLGLNPHRKNVLRNALATGVVDLQDPLGLRNLLS